EIVPVERDVQRAHRQRGAVDGRYLGAEPLGQRHAASAQADEGQLLGATVTFENLVGDTGERAIEGGFVEHLGFFAQARWPATHWLSLRASQGSVKGKNRSNNVTLLGAHSPVNDRLAPRAAP